MELTPDKVKSWFETEAGKKCYAELISDESEAQVAARVEKGELFTKADVDDKIAKVAADAKKESDAAAKLESDVSDIHAIFPTTPKAEIKAELEKHTNPDVRAAHVERMKAVATTNASRNTPAAPDAKPTALPSIEARFEAAIKKGLVSKPKDEKDHARKFRIYKANYEAYTSGS